MTLDQHVVVRIDFIFAVHHDVRRERLDVGELKRFERAALDEHVVERVDLAVAVDVAADDDGRPCTRSYSRCRCRRRR